ncbi:type IV secretion system protein VirB10 [Castellaniella sp. UC4442_H9]
MFKRTKPASEIDAADELSKVAGERGPSELRDSRRALPPGMRVFMFLVIAAGLGLSAWFTYRAFRQASANDADQHSPVARLDEGLKRLQFPKPPVAKPLEPVEPPPAAATDWHMPSIPKINVPVPVDPIKQRRLTSPLRADDQNGQSAGPADAQQARPRADVGPMADKLQALQLAPASATMLGNRDMLLTQGTRIDCKLLTRIVSTQAGMMTCLVPHDVWSESGRVVLIEAGTTVTGYKVGELQQGQNALFVTWSRLKTPAGVIINLNSPGTGPLGEAGIDGYIDTHFGERFGNAILLSLVGDFGNWAAQQGNRSNGGGTSISFDNTRQGTQDIVGKVLEKSIDIPPTLYKLQGEHIGITVARDLDFSSVYELKPLNPR